MADYILRGTKLLVDYRNTQNVDVSNERMASTLDIPIIHFAGGGRDGTSFVSKKYTEAQAGALATLLGVAVADVTTNGGQEIVG